MKYASSTSRIGTAIACVDGQSVENRPSNFSKLQLESDRQSIPKRTRSRKQQNISEDRTSRQSSRNPLKSNHPLRPRRTPSQQPPPPRRTSKTQHPHPESGVRYYSLSLKQNLIQLTIVVVLEASSKKHLQTALTESKLLRMRHSVQELLRAAREEGEDGEVLGAYCERNAEELRRVLEGG